MKLTKILNNIAALPKNLGKTLRNVWLELRQVDWLSANQVVKSTVLVLVLSAALTILVAYFDQILVAVREILLNRTLI